MDGLVLYPFDHFISIGGQLACKAYLTGRMLMKNFTENIIKQDEFDKLSLTKYSNGDTVNMLSARLELTMIDPSIRFPGHRPFGWRRAYSFRGMTGSFAAGLLP